MDSKGGDLAPRLRSLQKPGATHRGSCLGEPRMGEPHGGPGGSWLARALGHPCRRTETPEVRCERSGSGRHVPGSGGETGAALGDGLPCCRRPGAGVGSGTALWEGASVWSVGTLLGTPTGVLSAVLLSQLPLPGGLPGAAVHIRGQARSKPFLGPSTSSNGPGKGSAGPQNPREPRLVWAFVSTAPFWLPCLCVQAPGNLAHVISYGGSPLRGPGPSGSV